MLIFLLQDIERLYPEERNIVKVTLVEANQILSSFDIRLRRYAEGKIRQRSQMNLLSGSVVGTYVCQNVWISKVYICVISIKIYKCVVL